LGQADFIPWEARMTLKTVELAPKECAHDPAAPYHRFAESSSSSRLEGKRCGGARLRPRTLLGSKNSDPNDRIGQGNAVRCIKTGKGPTLVLLHTLRNQLDIFERLIPLLSKWFTVYALDYPGHGFSDIPETDHDPDLFVRTVEEFLDKLDLKNVTLVGIFDRRRDPVDRCREP
jgi:pimeloyl-ACP methyl ester carboxylesterase